MPGVYASFTGPLPPRSRIWAGLLAAGDDAALTARTALWWVGAVSEPGAVVHVVVPHGRNPVERPGLDARGCRHLDAWRHPAALPPMVRVEQALLDEAERANAASDAIGSVLEVFQRRATTPARVAEALRHRSRHRRRDLLHDLLDDAAEGVASALEHRYLRDVERAHGLPRADRNARTIRAVGAGIARITRPDLRYPRRHLVVELDGAAYHPEQSRHRDRSRDNDTMLAGERTLRAGWHEVVALPCLTASQVGLGLRLGGWRGRARRCGPDCSIDASLLIAPAASSGDSPAR